MRYEVYLRPSLKYSDWKPQNVRPYSSYRLYGFDICDMIGSSWTYTTASASARRVIAARHENFVRGWMYFYSTNSRVPKNIRDWYGQFGWPSTQFLDNGGFPKQLYTRNGARAVNPGHVLRQQDVQSEVLKPHPILIGSHPLDVHGVQWIRLDDERVWCEGVIQRDAQTPNAYTRQYQVGFAHTHVPDAINFSVASEAVSATHVAASSVRTRAGAIAEASATGAVLALRHKAHYTDMAAETSAALRARGIPLDVPLASAPERG